MSLMGRPIEITPALLTSSDVTETATVYASTTSFFNVGDLSYDATTRRIYESIQIADVARVVTFTPTGSGQPVQVNLTNHGYPNLTPITFTSTGSAENITMGNTYYVRNAGTNDFQLSSTPAGAIINDNDNSITQSGVHTSHVTANRGHALTDTDWWIDAGPMNKWAMFDGFSLTKSTKTTSIQVVLDVPGKFDCMAFIGMENATSVTILCKNGATTRYNQTYSLADTAFDEVWATPSTTESAYTPYFAVSDIPVYTGMTVTVTITGSGTVAIADLVIALSKDIGKAQFKSTSGIKDFSKKEISEFFDITLIERGFSKRGTFTVSVDDDRADGLQALFEENRATPNLWLMAPGSTFPWRPRSIYYGIWQSFDFSFDEFTSASYGISLEGF